MGTQGTYFYRPAYGAYGESEYNAFDAGLVAADAKLVSLDLIPIITTGTDIDLTTAQVKGHLVLVTATATIVLPAVVVGASVTIYSTTAAAIMVDPNANDRIILDGVAGGDGKKITSASAAGDCVTLVGDSVDGWIVIGRSGTWTMES